MFSLPARHVRRVTFASKLFPPLQSASGLNQGKLKQLSKFDGEVFCGGRSRNKDLLTFFGFIADSAITASFIQLPTFRRSLKKLANLVEHELETIGAQEVLLPTLVPQKLWKQSQRLDRQPDALDHVYKLQDCNENDLLLGPTFEESITKLVAKFDSISENSLPLRLYQTSSKFRQEPNPRFGLLRSNEFLMNDLYSFDADLARATHTYEAVHNLYDSLFRWLGLDYIRIQSGTGSIGGKYSHEYQLPVSSGEDIVIKCNTCHHAYNSEMDSAATLSGNSGSCIKCGSDKVSCTQAIELGHTFLLSDIYSKPLGAKFTPLDGSPKKNYQMGCYGLGLSRILGAGVDLFSITPQGGTGDEILQLRWPKGVEPYKFGLVTPAKRSKVFNAGSTTFIEQLVVKILQSTEDVDFIIEDRDKGGIAQRLNTLKSLGIPNILIVGRRFHEEPPQVEFLRLDPVRKDYDQYWFTEDQLMDYTMQHDS